MGENASHLLDLHIANTTKQGLYFFRLKVISAVISPRQNKNLPTSKDLGSSKLEHWQL